MIKSVEEVFYSSSWTQSASVDASVDYYGEGDAPSPGSRSVSRPLSAARQGSFQRKSHDEGQRGGTGKLRQSGERPRSPRDQTLPSWRTAVLQPGLLARAVGEGEGLLLWELLHQVNTSPGFICFTCMRGPGNLWRPSDDVWLHMHDLFSTRTEWNYRFKI